LFAHALLLLAVSCVGAWRLRESSSQLTAFCGCAIYFVGFALAYAVLGICDVFRECSTLTYFVSILIAIVFLLIVAGILYRIKKALGLRHADEHRPDDSAVHPGAEGRWPIWARRIPYYTSTKPTDSLESQDDPFATDWAERIEHIENEYGALALAVLWTSFAEYLIVGERGGSQSKRATDGRNFFLLYACVLLLTCALITTMCGNMLAGRNLTYFRRRALLLFRSFLVLCTAWAFLSWAQLQICGYWLASYPTFGEVSVAGLFLIIMLGRIALIGLSIRGQADIKGRLLSLRALALIVGWSFESSLNTAMEIHTQGWPSATALRVIVALVLGVTLLPIYVFYYKPITSNLEGV